jgi:hypothetical protein
MERLSAQDLSMVLTEDFGWPQDIGALAILDGSRLPPGADGRFPVSRPGAKRRQDAACLRPFMMSPGHDLRCDREV